MTVIRFKYIKPLQKSYKTKEMNPKKFSKNMNLGDIILGLYNYPNINYNCYSCEDCKHYKKCPQDIKNYHNLEASISDDISAPAWCMGIAGYRHFKANWNKALKSDKYDLKRKKKIYKQIHDAERRYQDAKSGRQK